MTGRCLISSIPVIRIRTLGFALGLALALPLASARAGDREAEAERLESESRFAAAAAIWEELIDAATSPEERAVFAFRAQDARRTAAVATGDVQHLCRAHLVVARYRERTDLDEDTRRDFDGFAREIQRALEDLGELCEITPEPPPPAAITPSQVDRDSESPSPTAAPLGEDPRATGKALAVTGGVLVGVGAAMGGLMTYGLVENYRAGEELLRYVSKNETIGLTDDEAADVEAARRRTDVSSRLAIAAGISGGAALVAGVTLLAVKARRARAGRSAVALHPTLDPRSAGLVLRGSF